MIEKYRDAIKQADRVTEEEYERRLAVCRDCDKLLAGTCGASCKGDKHGIDLVESPGHINNRHQRHHPGGGAQQGQGNAEKGSCLSCSVYLCCVIDILVYR